MGRGEIGSGLMGSKGIEGEYLSVTHLPGPGADGGEADGSRVSQGAEEMKMFANKLQQRLNSSL